MALVIRSDRWDPLAAPVATVWEHLKDVGAYQAWWPWLRSFDADALRPGAVWRCVVVPLVPRPMRFRLTLTEVVARRTVAAEVDGDIRGEARFDLHPDGGGSQVHLVSSLEAGSAELRFLSALARPVARRSHDWVIDTGLRQLRDHVVAAARRGTGGGPSPGGAGRPAEDPAAALASAPWPPRTTSGASRSPSRRPPRSRGSAPRGSG